MTGTYAHATAHPVYKGYPARLRSPESILIKGRVLRGPSALRGLYASIERSFSEPFSGITTDGTLRPDLYALATSGDSVAAAVGSARVYLTAVAAQSFPELGRIQLPVDSPERRMWTNAFPTWEPGVRLCDMSAVARAAAMDVIKATLSARGFHQVRDVMKLNEALGATIANDIEGTLREWTYWFTIFGQPGADGPWGWQLMGHHLDVNCLFVGDQITLAPIFLGAELQTHDDGPMLERPAFHRERQEALDLIGSFDSGQLAEAVLYDSMRNADLPPERNHVTEGRQQATTGRDNAVIPYEGISARDLAPAQRDQLLAVIDVYASRSPEGNRHLVMERVREHLDETCFAWIGSTHGRLPFYYKVHTPVILIEFDHHSGVFLANDEPEPFHVHTIVRNPNGNDYGMDLLRRHRQRYHTEAPTDAVGAPSSELEAGA